jgi:hypothetical protein
MCRVVHIHVVHVSHWVHWSVRACQMVISACRLIEAVVGPAIHVSAGQCESHLAVHMGRGVVCGRVVVQTGEQDVSVCVGVMGAVEGLGGGHEHGGGVMGVGLHCIARQSVVWCESTRQSRHMWVAA